MAKKAKRDSAKAERQAPEATAKAAVNDAASEEAQVENDPA